MAGHRNTVGKTANKKLTKLYWLSWKRSPNGYSVIVTVEPKEWRGTFKFVPTPLYTIMSRLIYLKYLSIRPGNNASVNEVEVFRQKQ